MGRAISYDERVKIVERVKAGESYETIALDINRSIVGVKKIWYAYKKEGTSAFKTKYLNCGRSSEYAQAIRDDLNQLRDNQQGADYVHSKFLAQYPDRKAPHPRTLNRWWQEAGTARPKGRPSTPEKKSGVSLLMKLGK